MAHYYGYHWLNDISGVGMRMDMRSINTLRHEQNGEYFADNICKGIFVNELVCVLNQFLDDFVPKGSFDKGSALQQVQTWDPFYLHRLTLIPAWISDYIHYKVWDDTTYPFLNFNGTTVEV